MIAPPCLCLDLPAHILEWPSVVRIDVREVRRQWYRNGRDLFQYHPRELNIFAGEVHMVCFDLEMELCAGFACMMDALGNCIPVSLPLAVKEKNHNREP